MPARRRARGRLPLGLSVAALIAAVIAVLPLVYLAIRAGQLNAARVMDVLSRVRSFEQLGRSVLLAAVVTMGSLVLGVGSAWVVARTDVPLRRLWAVLAALPLAVPTYVAAYAWVAAVPNIAGFGGAALVLTVCCYPYVYLPVVATLRGVDPAWEEASRSAGVGPVGTFRRVTLRQIRPAAAAGSLLVALYVISDFGSVSILRYETLTVGIYRSFTNNPFDRTAPVVLSGLLVVVTAIIVIAEARSRGRGRYSRLGGGAARPAAVVPLGGRRTPVLAGMTALSGLALGVPAASLAFWLVIGRSGEMDVPEIFTAAATSAGLAVGGAVVTTVLALPVGLLAARHAGWFPRLMERAAYVGHAVPGVVVALSLVFFAVNYAFGLYQSVPLVLFAYAVLFLPLAVAGVHASAAQSPPALEEVARSLGSPPRQVLRRVTLPLAAPGIAAAAVLVFITCIKELTATLMLQPTGTSTLATELWTQTSVRAYAAAAPYAALLVLLSAVPAYLLGRRSHRWGVRHE